MIEFRDHGRVLEKLRERLIGDPFWARYLEFQARQSPKVSVHIAVCIEPFLQSMLVGAKNLESRFSMNRCAPYNKVEAGDIILLKASGGPIVGVCRAGLTEFQQLDSDSIEEIRTQHSKALCANEDQFWDHKKQAKYCSLIALEHTRPVQPIPFVKRDRRGWVVYWQRENSTEETCLFD